MASPPAVSGRTAPAKVWQGVRMLSQEFALLPERCETKTRLARARAGEAAPMKRTATDRATQRRRAFMESSFEEDEVFEGESYTASRGARLRIWAPASRTTSVLGAAPTSYFAE